MTDEELYKKEVMEELKNILSYWMDFAIDERGGFQGKINNNNIADPFAPKGSVLNSRILWTFSAAYTALKDPRYLKIAERAANYLSEYFIDKEYGGVYWTLDYTGKPLETKKQVYAQAFAIYAFAEHYRATASGKSKQQAIELYELLIKYTYDKQHGGYAEAMSRAWEQIDNVRLSEKDENERKTMNTHLHVLEAFTSLYGIWKEEKLKEKLEELIDIFPGKIINKHSGHLDLFFDDEWKPRSSLYSYGHDIEAGWLLLEAAEAAGNTVLLNKVRIVSERILNAAMEGLDTDGGLWYEYNPQQGHLVKEKHWWPQAEAMVGFYTAYQLTGNNKYLDHSLASWRFISKYIIDSKRGEWFWGVDANYQPMQEDKAGLWKCPYHNGRACLEIIKRTGETFPGMAR